MRHPNILVGLVAAALVGLFLFISHLGEPSSRSRLLFELLLATPLMLYVSTARARSSV